jgi:hypothetical protein
MIPTSLMIPQVGVGVLMVDPGFTVPVLMMVVMVTIHARPRMRSSRLLCLLRVYWRQ